MQFLLCIDLVRPVLLDHLGLESVISFAREILQNKFTIDYLEDQIQPGNAMIFFAAVLHNGSALFRLPRSSRAAR